MYVQDVHCFLDLFNSNRNSDYIFLFFIPPSEKLVVVVLLFNVHGKHLRSCRDGQLT